jgi:hypothetical protein
MKKKFVFDSMESDFSDIKEETIIENTGVDTERIVNTVMEAAKAKKIRRFTKKGIIGLAAAVAAAIAIGTVSVGASGGFNKAFGNWFAGEPKYGLFAGSNVSEKSDKLDIEFQGIAGDDMIVGAVMEIKNKDGSAFIDENDGKYLIYGSHDVDVTLPPLLALFHNPNDNRSGSLWYDFKDENTIQATAFYQDFGGHLKGERMTVKEKSLWIVHLDEAIGTYLDDYDELYEKYKDRIGENQLIFTYSQSGSPEDNIRYIATEKTIPFEFETGVTLNYKTASRAIDDFNGKEFSMNDVTMTIDNIRAQSFMMVVDATISAIQYPEDPLWDNPDLDADSEEMRDYMEKMQSLGFIIEFDITLKDGSKVTTEADSRWMNSNSASETKDTMQCLYEKDGISAAIDPDDIVSVTATAKPLAK